MSYLVREPDALIGPVRFDEREVETGHGREIEAPADERAGYGWAWLKPPRHFSTLLFFPERTHPCHAKSLLARVVVIAMLIVLVMFTLKPYR